MEPQNIRFGGGVEQTFLNPIVLIATILAGWIICASRRRNALVAFLTAGILIPPDQILLLGPVHLPILRILGICALGRVCWTKLGRKQPVFASKVSGMDMAVFAFGTFTLIDGLILWQARQELFFQLGQLLTILGVYIPLRFFIRDENDIKHAIRTFACIAALVAAIMVVEHVTGRNVVYSALEGARASVLGTAINRDDHLRAAGTFAHPILAGTFGGILLPLFIGLWLKEKESRKYAAVGVVSSGVISFAASSTTALFGLFGGIAGLCFWPLRRRMRIVRWGTVLTLLSLHIYMRSPVWHLISDIDLTGNSSSYHRYQLLNQCIIHFWDWVFVGTKNYADWGWDMWDLCNQYVAVANQSGIIPLASLVTIIILGFRYVGKRWPLSRDRRQQLFTWAVGAALFANVVAFFGVSYFDQTIIGWYAVLAMLQVIIIPIPKHNTMSPLTSTDMRGLLDSPDSVLVSRAGVAVSSQQRCL
jgi:hypothetical protein